MLIDRSCAFWLALSRCVLSPPEVDTIVPWNDMQLDTDVIPEPNWGSRGSGG